MPAAHDVWRPALAIAAIGVLASPTAHAITLADPASYAVKNTWSAATLAVPTNLGGLMFAPGGDTLYVVGASETVASALYQLPVTRDAITHAVTGLGTATKVFDSTQRGLDAGLELGPAGTFFYSYWPDNFLGERPGGVAGAETKLDMAPYGVPVSISGITFSPHLTDPGTGFGQMQISVWSGKNIYDVPLTPAGAGVFTPGTIELFVTLPFAGTSAIQYVPSGPFAGDLMYVNYSFGEVRVLSIDDATGLPIDKTSGQPLRGTNNPADAPFASALGIGPWGLEFDPVTSDFFVGTWSSGNPSNTIIQIGGAGFPSTTTTSTTTSTTTTTTVTVPTTTTTTSTTTPTTAALPTTTTTLPAGCSPGASFQALACRLAELVARVNVASELGTFQPKLAQNLAKATARMEAAETSCAERDAKHARARLKQAARAMIQYAHRLRGRSARKKLDTALREELLGAGDPIQAALKSLRSTVRCPDDAATGG